MKNAFSKGTEGINHKKHTFFPTNEDKVIVVEVLSIDNSKRIVQGKKIWDEDSSIFYALNFYQFPFEVGSYAVFRRVGDFNSNPGSTPSEYELRIENPAKVSWVCFPHNPVIFVKDIGGGNGREVRFDSLTATFVLVPGGAILPIVQMDPSSQFHNGNPPFQADRIYWGKRVNNKFLVNLPGYGPKYDTVQEIESNADYEYTVEFDRDSQGNILDFRASAVEISIPPLDPMYIFLRWGYNSSPANPERNSEYRCNTILVPGGHKCVMEGMSIEPPPYHPHDPSATSWKVNFYAGYIPAAKQYFNFIAKNEYCQFNDYGGEPIYVETAGTEITNKDRFYPNWDIYKDAAIEGAYGRVQYVEKGSVLYGDRSSAYEHGPSGNETIFLYPHWVLRGVFWPEYDHLADIPGIYGAGGDYCCIDGGRGDTYADGYFNWDNNAHIGFNDESSNGWLLSTLPQSMGSEWDVPGWPGIQAFAYCIDNGIYVPGYGVNGGRVCWPRDHTRWRFKNQPGPWRVGLPGQILYAHYASDSWKSIRTGDISYFSNIPPLYQSNNRVVLI